MPESSGQALRPGNAKIDKIVQRRGSRLWRIKGNGSCESQYWRRCFAFLHSLHSLHCYNQFVLSTQGLGENRPLYSTFRAVKGLPLFWDFILERISRGIQELAISSAHDWDKKCLHTIERSFLIWGIMHKTYHSPKGSWQTDLWQCATVLDLVSEHSNVAALDMFLLTPLCNYIWKSLSTWLERVRMVTKLRRYPQAEPKIRNSWQSWFTLGSPSSLFEGMLLLAISWLSKRWLDHFFWIRISWAEGRGSKSRLEGPGHRRGWGNWQASKYYGWALSQGYLLCRCRRVRPTIGKELLNGNPLVGRKWLL